MLFRRIVSATVVVLILSLSACAPVSRFLARIEEKLFTASNNDDEPKPGLTYEEILDTRNVRASGDGYKREYKGALLQDQLSSFSSGYRWIPPVVQNVKVPAMIRGGTLIPAHEEYVIINDAAYVIGNEQSDAVRTRYRIPEGVEIVSPLKGSDVVLAVFRMNPVFAESVVIPVDKISFILMDKGMDRVLALRNNEVAQVGNFLLTFEREKRDEFITAGIAEDGLKSVRTYSLTRSHVLFLSNGYVILPMFEMGSRRDS